jgi:hypothetical protein
VLGGMSSEVQSLLESHELAWKQVIQEEKYNHAAGIDTSRSDSRVVVVYVHIMMCTTVVCELVVNMMTPIVVVYLFIFIVMIYTRSLYLYIYCI